MKRRCAAITTEAARVRRQPPQDNGIAREACRTRPRSGRDRSRQGAGRARPRRHHARRDRDVDSGGDYAGAAQGSAERARAFVLKRANQVLTHLLSSIREAPCISAAWAQRVWCRQPSSKNPFRDGFMVTADFDTYWQAQRLIWDDPARWWPRQSSTWSGIGSFSSYRTIREYAEEIWRLPVP